MSRLTIENYVKLLHDFFLRKIRLIKIQTHRSTMADDFEGNCAIGFSLKVNMAIFYRREVHTFE